MSDDGGWVGASSYYGLRVGLEHYGLSVGLEHYGLRVGLEHYGLRVGLEHYGLSVGLEHYGLRVGLERPHGWVGASSYYGLRVGLERPHGRVGASSYYGLRVGLEHYGLRVGLEHYGLRSQVMMMWSIWFWFVDLLVREQGPSYDQSLPVVGDHIHSMSSHVAEQHQHVMMMWSIWFWVLLSGDVHVSLWISLCANRVPPMTKSFCWQN
ncbi:hypothetical protein DPMN_009905 [Dreissena polymorpha]|uniref:Uncharacterized protein n=1 Tax=Dreissena polymorpha TaxID=45954 RepID=A0A9D4N126_DREPO|nr:hypothetical protein DPMN_009905 [Dreissena polymorpha]